MTCHLHPFEVYKLAIGMKLHYTTESFQIGMPLHLKSQKFESNKHANYYAVLSNKFDKEVVEDIIISNLLHDPNTYITNLTNKNAVLIMEKWKERFKNIEQIFYSEICKLINEFNIDDFSVLFKVDSCQKIATIAVDDFMQIINDKNFVFKKEDNKCMKYMKTMTPEVLAILDEILVRKYNGKSFLKDQWVQNPSSSAVFLRCLKYKQFLPMDEFLNKKKIKQLMEML